MDRDILNSYIFVAAVIIYLVILSVSVLTVIKKTEENREIMMKIENINNIQIRTLNDKIDSVRMQSLRLWLNSK